MQETVNQLQAAYKTKVEGLQGAAKLCDLAWVESADPRTVAKELENLLNNSDLAQQNVAGFKE